MTPFSSDLWYATKSWTVDHVTSFSRLLLLFHPRTQKRKEKQPRSGKGVEPKQSLIGADCHVPKVTS